MMSDHASEGNVNSNHLAEETINEQVLSAQKDEAAFARFTEEHRKFILAQAYHATGHYVTQSDDEWSVALIAFHEAVKTFDSEKGTFHAFASVVIRRRLYDYLKKEGRHAPEIPTAPEMMEGEVPEGEEESALAFVVRKKEAELSKANDAEGTPGTTPVRDEIEAVQGLLQSYGFSFFDLADCSPKAEKTKEACAKAVALLLTDAALFEKMRKTKTLPAKEIIERTGIPRKIPERHRKYLIAAAEILNGEYPLLQEYMQYIRKALVT